MNTAQSISTLAQDATLQEKTVQKKMVQDQAVSKTVQTNSSKANLLGMTRAELEAFFEKIGEKKFRAGQVMKWIHQFGVTDFEEMTNISGKLR